MHALADPRLLAGRARPKDLPRGRPALTDASMEASDMSESWRETAIRLSEAASDADATLAPHASRKLHGQ